MAFDQPLDADRVDGDGFISSFVRAPIVGPVMWVLGGLLSKDMAGEENKILEEDILNKDPPNQALPRTATNSKIYADSHRSIALPTSMECEPTHMNEVIHVTPSVSSEEDNDDRNIMPLARRKGRRKMSWADESGQSLDDYYEQSSKQSSVEGSSDNTIPAPAKNCKPIKSAMRSSRTGLNSIKNRTHRPSQCVPSMPSIKSKGGPPVNTKNGYVSPQWGWYISTTPPTPEYLQNSVNTNQGQSHQVATKNEPQQQHADTNRNVFVPSRQQWNPSTAPIREVSVSKPVFNKGNPNYSSGWPTVPL